MTVGLGKADVLHFFDRWSEQSEKSGELSRLERAEIKEAIRIAERNGTITIDALHQAFDGKGLNRDLIPDFALELLRIRGGGSIIGDATTFAEAARRLEAFCGRYRKAPDHIETDGTERYLSPHLEVLFRERVLGIAWNETPNVAGSHASKTGHHLFSETEPLAGISLVPNTAVDPHDFDQVFCVERDGRTFFVRGDETMNVYSAANLSAEEMEKRHVEGFIAWEAGDEPYPGSQGRTNKSGRRQPGGVDLDVVVQTPDGPQSIGVLSRNGLAGFATGSKLSLWMRQDPEFRQTQLCNRIEGANRARLNDLSVDSLDALDTAVAELIGQQGATVDAQLETMRTEIAEARAWRLERDAEHAARERAAAESLGDFSFGPGMFMRVAMHELHELVSRLPGFRRETRPLLGR